MAEVLTACLHSATPQGWTLVDDVWNAYNGLWVHADPDCMKPSKANLPEGLPTTGFLGSVLSTPESITEEPIVTVTTPAAPAPTTFAEAEVVLASQLPGYESRPQQQALAAFVETVLGSEGTNIGMAEAGCGTGKSLGAMIPAILSGKRTVVATATIALMEQYADKDVPFLQEKLGVPFTWALLKGRSNYVCRAKLLEATADRVPQLAEIMTELNENPTHDGDREHFATPVEKREFSHISMSSAECPGKRECPFGETCFAEAAKAKARASQVVVTNTAMLMTDLKVREATGGWGSMLEEFDAIVIDEAHELEEIATSQLEETLRVSAFDKLLKEIDTFAGIQSTSVKGGQAVRDAVTAVLAEIPVPEGRESTMRLTQSWFVDHAEPFMVLVEALAALRAEILGVTIVRDDQRAAGRRDRLVVRVSNQIKRYEALLFTPDEEVVRWVETEEVSFGRGGMQKVLHYAPVYVGGFLQEWLWEGRQGVLVSATMSVGGEFDYLQKRLGLQECQTINVGTPFDYDTQAMLYVPDPNAPSPKNRSAWVSYAGIKMLQLVDAAQGGALLLFTSRSALTAAYENYGPLMEERGFTVLAQGHTGSNKAIAKVFKEDVHSVLFALKSFFTGVDIPGEACRLVVIDKLPFPVPSEPVFAARADMIKRAGGSDFSGLSVPMMTLTLTQGFGRLIRTAKDYGVVAILDSRLSSTSWGRSIVNRLPDSPASTDMADVELFYAGHRA